MTIKLSIIIPVYNEKINIENGVKQLKEAFSNYLDSLEIIFVDDNSPDGTAQEVERISKDHPEVTLLQHGVKEGIGAAHKAGYEVAIVLFFNDRNFELRGFANASLQFENPNFSIDLAVICLLVAACSAKTFCPTIPRSATPLETSDGMSSSLTKSMSISILDERANSFSPEVEKLIPDLINNFLLLSKSLPFLCIAIVIFDCIF